ncbi:MAG: zinc-binding alcohol dehydrogenase family protein [Cellvibrionales bacterium]|nr:zinc-binding alcohol dehydrogenase family protein [Cellvibrionales bacterium]
MIDSATSQPILKDIEMAIPTCEDNDLLIKVESIAVNPVDTKIRNIMTSKDISPKILGFDASGEVVVTGQSAEGFTIGDKVYYAGSITRPGSNAEYQCVDAAIVSHTPKSLSQTEAAALPLTGLTACEMLFEHLCIDKSDNAQLLIVGAAGGVGSMLIQLAKALTDCTVIATASRHSSKSWVESLGADVVINHAQPMKPQLDKLGLAITHIASCQNTPGYFDQYVDLITPFGSIAFIDSGNGLDVMKLKNKSLSLHYEYMFARAMFHAKDRSQQGEWLALIAKLVDQKKIQTTLQENLGQINAANLEKAHQLLLTHKMVGKIVLSGF